MARILNHNPAIETDLYHQSNLRSVESIDHDTFPDCGKMYTQ